MCAHVCTCMWNTDQCWVSSFFTLLRQGRLLDLEITDWLDWLANELPESFCLLFPCLGTRAYMAAGEQTQVLIYLLCLLPCLPSTLLMPQRLSPQETSLARIRLDPSRTTHNSTLVLHLSPQVSIPYKFTNTCKAEAVPVSALYHGTHSTTPRVWHSAVA